jgi:hypothetical protein
MQREPDRLRRSRIQTQLGAEHDDTRTNKIGEGRKLGASQIIDLDPTPCVPDEEVLIGCKRLDAIRETFDEIFRGSGGGLASDCVHDTEHVLGAMIDLAHEEVLPFLALLSLVDVLDGADEAHDPSLTARALKTMSKPLGLQPANLTVPPPEAELRRGSLRLGGIERSAVGPKPFPHHLDAPNS